GRAQRQSGGGAAEPGLHEGLESQGGSAQVARGHRPVPHCVLTISPRCTVSPPVLLPLLLLAVLCAGCADRAPNSAPPAAVPLGAEPVAAEQAPPGTPAPKPAESALTK